MAPVARRLACAALLLAASCAPRATPAPRTPAPKSADAAPVLIEYVAIRQRWVEKVAPASLADVKAWSADPANASVVTGAFRHILIKADPSPQQRADAKKRADGILERVNKGEDFATLAKQLSEDPGSRERGGDYPATDVSRFVAPVREAFQALAPGAVVSAPVESKFGFHVIKKELPNDDDVESAYKQAKAPALERRLAEQILARFKSQPSGDARAIIADATLEVLGERAVSDAARPKSFVIEREHVDRARLPAAAKAALETFAQGAKAGEVLPSPAVDGETLVVARAVGAEGAP